MAPGAREIDERVHCRRHVHDLRLGRPLPPIATTTTCRSEDSRRATCPVTAVFPTRLPVPTTASAGTSTGANEGASKRKSAPWYGSPWKRTRLGERHPLDRPEHWVVGQVEHELGRVRGDRLVDSSGKRHTVVLAAARFLGAADEDGRDDVVRHRGQRVAHDGA